LSTIDEGCCTGREHAAPAEQMLHPSICYVSRKDAAPALGWGPAITAIEVSRIDSRSHYRGH